MLQKKAISFADDMKRIQLAHDEELEKIKIAREQEVKQHETNVKKLQQTIDSVHLQYEEQKKNLDDKKKSEIDQLFKKYKFI